MGLENKGFNYFAEVLNHTVARVEFLRKGINALPENVTKEEAEIYTEEVQDLEANTPMQIKFPEISQIFKSGGLYLGAIKFVNNDSSKPTAGELQTEVSNIVKKEIYISILGTSDADKIAKEFAERELKKMYTNLVNQLKDSKIPTPNDFNVLEMDTMKKIKELKEAHMDAEAKKYQDTLDTFNTATFNAAKIYAAHAPTAVTPTTIRAPCNKPVYNRLPDNKN